MRRAGIVIPLLIALLSGCSGTNENQGDPWYKRYVDAFQQGAAQRQWPFGWFASSDESASGRFTARVVSVVDATTIKYQRGQQEPVTSILFGVTLPKVDSSNPVDVALSPLALVQVKSRIEGELVEIARIDFQTVPDLRDSEYAVHVYRQGRSVNQALIEDGFATPWPIFGSYSDTAIETLAQWKIKSFAARAEARGFWRTRCSDARTRFPGSADPEALVLQTMGTIMDGWGITNRYTPWSRGWELAFTQDKNVLVARWIADSLWNERHDVAPPTFKDYLATMWVDYESKGPWQRLPTQRWEDMQRWPVDSCEGAFLRDTANARFVGWIRDLAGRG